MPLVLVTPPAAEPLTAAEVRARLGLPSTVLDATITAWIKAEREKLDGAHGTLGRALITQTWDYIGDGFPGWATSFRPFFSGERQRDWPEWYYDQGISLPLAPVQSIDAVKYLDGDGAEQTVDAAIYRLVSGDPGLLVPAHAEAWPSAEAVRGAVTIRFTCGYGDAGPDVPENIRQAITIGVSLQRSLTSQNLFVSSETVEGVGSRSYSGGSNAAATIRGEIDRLLSGYMAAGIS
jgi:hypothetical protein